MASNTDQNSCREPVTSQMEIRHLPPHILNKLYSILDAVDSWKELVPRIPHPDFEDQLLFSANDIRSLEEQQFKSSKSPTESVFTYWSTFGRKRPEVGFLLKLLTISGLLRAAHYLAVDVLGEEPSAPETLDMNINDSGSGSLNDQSTFATQSGLPSSVQHYPYATLKKATLDFCTQSPSNGGRLLGEGAFGVVFLAQLNDNSCVAVKKLRNSIGKQFITELQILTRFEHENLLPLLGYSIDGPFTCLVYEYLSKGSLQQYLANKDNPLQWSKRPSIALGTARGIHFLHVHEDKPLVHRDIKSANILLDANLVPKLGDFGLAHIGATGGSTTVVVTTTVSGTTPYMAPEAFRGDVSTKMDVFSFGVVLLELLTSLPPYDPNREDMDLLSHVQENCDDICKLLDGRAGLWNTEVADSLYKVSVRCTKDSKRERPTMAQVVTILEEICLSVT